MAGPKHDVSSRPGKKLRVEEKHSHGSKEGKLSTQSRDLTRPKLSMKINGATERSGILKSSNPAKGKARLKEKETVSESESDQEEEISSLKSKDHATITSKKPVPARLPSSFKIIAGSYEKLLYGLHGTFSISPTFNADQKSKSPYPYTITLTPIFVFPAHVSCIKAVAASPSGGKWLATGSADEIIKVWDLRRRKEIGGLMHHEGSITHLVFPSRSHLLSASEDGSLCLFRARDWAVLRSLKGHKARVNAVAVHPSGKVALSVGRDRTLRMWDLMRGKGRASTKLGKEGEIVRWSIDGSCFAVQAGSTIDIYNTSMDLIHTINHLSRLHDILFCKRVDGKGEVLLAAAENKQLSVYDIFTPLEQEHKPRVVALLTGHANRVKAIQTLEIALPALHSPPSSSQNTGRISTIIVCTVSSDGKIHVYDLAMIPATIPDSSMETEPSEISPVAVYDSDGTRLTCVTLADGDEEAGGEQQQQTGEKRKRQEENIEPGDKDEDIGVREDGNEEEWLSEAETEKQEEVDDDDDDE